MGPGWESNNKDTDKYGLVLIQPLRTWELMSNITDQVALRSERQSKLLLHSPSLDKYQNLSSHTWNGGGGLWTSQQLPPRVFWSTVETLEYSMQNWVKQYLQIILSFFSSFIFFVFTFFKLEMGGGYSVRTIKIVSGKLSMTINYTKLTQIVQTFWHSYGKHQLSDTPSRLKQAQRNICKNNLTMLSMFPITW